MICVILLILRRTERDIVTNVRRSSCKGNLNFLDRLKKKIYSNFIKPVQWEPSFSMLTNGQTDRHDEAYSRFSQFCERV